MKNKAPKSRKSEKNKILHKDLKKISGGIRDKSREDIRNTIQTPTAT